MYRSTNFIIKSSTFRDNKNTEIEIISKWHEDLVTASRIYLGIDGGRSVLIAASIDMLFMSARVTTSLALPFAVRIDNKEIVFDEIEPSPVVEDFEPDVGSIDKCAEIVASFSCDPAIDDSVDVCIEASSKIAFSVQLTVDERSQFLQGCNTCFGYTTKQVQCKNKRKLLQGDQVWCYHHKHQKRDSDDFGYMGIDLNFAIGGKRIYRNVTYLLSYQQFAAMIS